MKTNIHETKTNLSKLLEKLATGEETEIIIAKSGTPIAKITPFTQKKRELGLRDDFPDYLESPDCWEPEKETLEAIGTSKIFPAPANQKHPFVAEDKTKYGE